MGLDIFIEPPIGAALPRGKPYSAAPAELDITFRSCIPRVSYRALPSFHPGLCRSVVPTALIMRLDFDALALPLQGSSTSPLSLYYFDALAPIIQQVHSAFIYL